MMEEFRVPVVVEVILEKVTNIAMGTDLDNVTEFEESPRAPERTTMFAMAPTTSHGTRRLNESNSRTSGSASDVAISSSIRRTR